MPTASWDLATTTACSRRASRAGQPGRHHDVAQPRGAAEPVQVRAQRGGQRGPAAGSDPAGIQAHRPGRGADRDTSCGHARLAGHQRGVDGEPADRPGERGARRVQGPERTGPGRPAEDAGDPHGDRVTRGGHLECQRAAGAQPQPGGRCRGDRDLQGRARAAARCPAAARCRPAVPRGGPDPAAR